MQEKIKSVIEALKNNFKTKNKNLLFIIAGIVVLIPLSLWLLSSESKPDLSDSFNKIQEKQSYTPPKMDNPFAMQLNKESNATKEAKETKDSSLSEEELKAQSTLRHSEAKAEESKKDTSHIRAQYDKDSKDFQNNLAIPKDKHESKIPTINGISDNQLDAIKKIAKSQKPSDMIAYLKEIQKDCELNKSNLTFKYDGRILKVGDKLNGWYKLEEITKNYVRFKDVDYAYNLRFLED